MRIVVDLDALNRLLYYKKMQIAERIGLAPDTLHRKTRGQREFKVCELNALAEALGVQVSEFVSIR